MTIQERIQQQRELIEMARQDLAGRTPGTQPYNDRVRNLRRSEAWLRFLEAQARAADHTPAGRAAGVRAEMEKAEAATRDRGMSVESLRRSPWYRDRAALVLALEAPATA